MILIWVLSSDGQIRMSDALVFPSKEACNNSLQNVTTYKQGELTGSGDAAAAKSIEAWCLPVHILGGKST
jgi:hypothetical protein